MEILAIEDLSFTYPAATGKALDNVSLCVDAGEFVVVCGQSGCGKTTLLRLVKRELAPHGMRSGTILYGGVDIAKLDERTAAGDIGYVMQNPENQVVTDKVWHELAYGLENLGVPNGQIRRRVGEMASFFGIDGFFRSDTATLSGGQKQLLNLAATMVMHPKILILDEPTSMLDPIAAADFITMLKKINRELGITVLLVEHRLEEVFTVADRVLVLDAGHIVVHASPAEAGQALRRIGGGHRMLAGMPSAVRIYNGLSVPGPCPLTLRQGRSFLHEHFRPAPFVPAESVQPVQESTPAVVVKNLWFRYEKQLPDVLQGVELQLPAGELLCILGGNGSGKTTLLRAIADQRKAYRGSIRILGRKLKDYGGNSLYKNTLALLPQDPQTMFLKPTLREDYTDICKVMELDKSESVIRIKEAAELLGITALLQRHPYDLSGGEQQKAALGKILLLRPKILLMDEPTKGIDAWSKQQLGRILRKLRAAGVSILTVTHDVEFAAENAQRCALLFDGQIAAMDETRAFFSGNQFYTTAANRIARETFPGSVTVQDVLDACHLQKEVITS